MNRIEITEEYCLNKKKYGWDLDFVSAVEKKGRDSKTGGTKITRETKTWHFGALNDGLRGFAKEYYENSNSIDEVIDRINEARNIIKDAFKKIETLDAELAHEYKIVKISSN